MCSLKGCNRYSPGQRPVVSSATKYHWQPVGLQQYEFRYESVAALQAAGNGMVDRPHRGAVGYICCSLTGCWKWDGCSIPTVVRWAVSVRAFQAHSASTIFLSWLFVADGVGEGLVAFGREEARWGRLGQAGDDFFVADGAE